MSVWFTEEALQWKLFCMVVDTKFTFELNGQEGVESLSATRAYICALDAIDVDAREPDSVLYRFPASVRPAPPNYPVGPPPCPPPRPPSVLPFDLPSVPPVLPTPQTDWRDSYSADSESEYEFESSDESE